MNSEEFSKLVELSRSMQSLVAKLASKEHLICRDISDLRGHIVSQQSRIDISLDAISRSLVVLHDRIESIVRNQDTLMNLVSVLMKEKSSPEMILLSDSPKTPQMEVEELPDSQPNIPVRSTSPDITCYETIGQCSNPNPDQTFDALGFGEILEWGKVDELMKNYQKLM